MYAIFAVLLSCVGVSDLPRLNSCSDTRIRTNKKRVDNRPLVSYNIDGTH